jgi:hypothetical protein
MQLLPSDHSVPESTGPTTSNSCGWSTDFYSPENNVNVLVFSKKHQPNSLAFIGTDTMGNSSSSSNSENYIVPSSTTSAVCIVASQEQARAPRAPRAPRRTHSVAHQEFKAKNIVLFNIDLETGGDSCGPVQILVAAYDPHESKNLAEFDSYVKPAKGALWSQATINMHGILPTQQRIKEADELEEVW